MKYALYFVPHKLEREKLALRRRQLCKRFENRKAVMYPIHLTLVKEIEFHDYNGFMVALEEFLAQWKPIKVRAEQQLGNGRHWGGVVLKESPALLSFQQELLALVRNYATVTPFLFQPHISLVYAKSLPSLQSQTSPVKKLVVDRVTLALQTDKKQPFRVAKHIQFKRT